MENEMEKKEEMGLKDTVETEVKKGKAGSKNLAAAAKRGKAISDAHDKYVQDTEAARVAYVNAKKQANQEFEEATR